MEPPSDVRDAAPDAGLRWLTPLLVTVTVVTLLGVASMLVRGRPLEVLWARWILHNAPMVVPILWAGRRILRRQPDHACGWLLVATGVVTGLHVGVIAVADAGLVAAGHEAAALLIVPAELPLATSIPLWVSAWLWIPGGVLLCLLVLLLPDGRLPSPRWRWVPVTGVVGTIVFASAYVIEAWPGSRLELDLGNTMGQLPVTRVAIQVGSLLTVVTAVAAIAALVTRWRTDDPTQRRQVRLVGVAGALTLVVFFGTFPWQDVWVPLSLLVTWGFTGAYLVAITRYRLHDLDLVLSRTVVGTVLAALVTGLYLLIVVGIGALLGRQSQGTWLPLVAVGVTAILFDPARRRVQRGVDRLLYGREGDPTQVLSALAARLREAVSADEVLDRAVMLLATSTGASRAEIAVAVDGREQLVAGGSSQIEPAAPVLVAPVIHRGDRLGEVRLFARAATDLVPHADELLRDVAGTLGVVLANVQLTAELEAQVVELRRSRTRLANAHDAARRELERDLHDGAQARLIALRIHLGLAGAMAEIDASPALCEVLASLEDEVDEVVRSLRRLARGLHPPVLQSEGVAAALRSSVQGLPVPVTVTERRFGRYGADLEAAIFFACLETVQNAMKHAGGVDIEVTLVDHGEELRFVVQDAGAGFDPTTTGDGSGLGHVADRIAAAGGHVTIDTAPGQGCRVEGRVPLATSSPATVDTDQPLVADR
jgi:two-component system, NarL family, sensor kinase